MEKVLVSACLLGERVRYDGRDALARDTALERWRAEGRLVPVCPEVSGGLPTPRPPAEIAAGAGGDAVLDGAARVVARTGDDVTEAFLAGARRALELAREHGCRVAVLKERSPSCGSAGVYDGTFSGALRPGRGVAAALLEREGVRVFGESEVERADEYLRALEAGGGPRP